MNEVVDAVDGIIRRNTLTEQTSNFNNNKSSAAAASGKSPLPTRDNNKARMMR